MDDGGLAFNVVVHGATALSTIVVFRRDIVSLVRGLFVSGEPGRTARGFAGLILLSMVPVGVVGLLFKDAIEARLDGHLGAVGAALLVTAALLFWAQRRGREGGRSRCVGSQGSSDVPAGGCSRNQPERGDDFCGAFAGRGPGRGGPV